MQKQTNKHLMFWISKDRRQYEKYCNSVAYLVFCIESKNNLKVRPKILKKNHGSIFVVKYSAWEEN